MCTLWTTWTKNVSYPHKKSIQTSKSRVIKATSQNGSDVYCIYLQLRTHNTLDMCKVLTNSMLVKQVSSEIWKKLRKKTEIINVCFFIIFFFFVLNIWCWFLIENELVNLLIKSQNRFVVFTQTIWCNQNKTKINQISMGFCVMFLWLQSLFMLIIIFITNFKAKSDV